MNWKSSAYLSASPSKKRLQPPINIPVHNPTDASKKKNRKRKIIWFNPPFSSNVPTNIGKVFLKQLDKHFLPGHKLRPICNRNWVKISYSCMPNIASIIKSHSTKLTAPESMNENPAWTCNCRRGTKCPLNGECLKNCIVYQATFKSENKQATYFGFCATTFKARYNNHTLLFRHQQKSASTDLSKHVLHQNKKLQNRVEYCPASSPIPLWHKIMRPLTGRNTPNNTSKAGDITKQMFQTNFQIPT